MNEFHREEMFAVIGPPGLIDGGDRRVLEARERLCFSLEQPQAVLIHVLSAANHLDRDHASWRLLLSFVDDPHPSVTQSAMNKVGANPSRDRRSRWDRGFPDRLDAGTEPGSPVLTGRASSHVFGHFGCVSVEPAPELLFSQIATHSASLFRRL